jgi:hypothetical protein
VFQEIQRRIELTTIVGILFDVQTRCTGEPVDIVYQTAKARQAGGVRNARATKKTTRPSSCACKRGSGTSGPLVTNCMVSFELPPVGKARRDHSNPRSFARRRGRQTTPPIGVLEGSHLEVTLNCRHARDWSCASSRGEMILLERGRSDSRAQCPGSGSA